MIVHIGRLPHIIDILVVMINTNNDYPYKTLSYVGGYRLAFNVYRLILIVYAVIV